MPAPSPAAIQYQLQHFNDDKSNQIIYSFGISLGFAIIAVLLRFLARHLNRASLGADDWTIVVGLFLAIGYVVGQSVGIYYGLGKHAVRVTDPVALARTINASVPFYISSLSATKASILLLYRRIFPNRRFHIILWAIGAFVLAFTVANVLFIIFQCRPISAGFNPLIKAKCINNEAAVLVVAILTIITDFIILCLPLPLVWKLQLPMSRKIQISLILLLGTFASVISIYRATVVMNVKKDDLSYTSSKRAIWSGVEICAAIVCANLAPLRPIIKYIFKGHSLSSDRSGSGSRRTASSAGKKSHYQRWTWRTIKPAAENKDSRSNLLQPHSPFQKLDDIEGQKYERYLMSPVNSPKPVHL